MSLTRHARFALRVVSGLRHRPWQVRAGASRRWKASTTAAESMDGPEPPNGFLFNEKPLLPGEKRQKEDWENVWVYSMAINLLLVIAICTLKPDTSVSAWAKQKAIERLAEKDVAQAEASNSDSDE